ncbi:MAG TPA: hypothetical protein VGF17_15060 [Phytomonospora sp.]
MGAPRPGVVWGGLLAAGVAYETYGLFGDVEGDTLSEVTRALFRTSHPVGKAVFLAGYVGFSSWFVPHIVCKVSGAAREIRDTHAEAGSARR